MLTTEQKIREQTQAVLDAYLMLNRCGISLSDFLELRREAIQELGEAEGPQPASTKDEQKEQKEQNERNERNERNKRYEQNERIESTHASIPNRNGTSEKINHYTKKAVKKASAGKEETEETAKIAESAVDESEDADQDDFLEGFYDPWN